MAGRSGPSEVTVTLQDSPGGTPQNIENYTEDGLTAADVVDIVENTALGNAWKGRVPTGVRDGEDITIKGDWDTTATTGSHAIFQMAAADVSPQSVGRELVFTPGDSKTWTRKFHLKSYKVIAQNGNIHKFEAVLSPTGAAVWA